MNPGDMNQLHATREVVQPDQQCPACAGDPPGHVCGFCGRGQSEPWFSAVHAVAIAMILFAFLVLWVVQK